MSLTIVRDIQQLPFRAVSVQFGAKELGIDRVKLWSCRVKDIDSSILAKPEQLGVLAPDELARRVRFRFEHDRDLFVTSRLLLRSVLSNYGRLDPGEWRFTVSPWGRPQIAQGSATETLHFNLSHSNGLAICAVAGGYEIGVDIEFVDGESDVTTLARRVCAVEELHYIESVRREERQKAFLRYWTLKEAYGKARGVGMVSSPASLVFDLAAADHIQVKFCEPILDRPGDWMFCELMLSDGYVGALALGVSVTARFPVPRHMRPKGRIGRVDYAV